ELVTNGKHALLVEVGDIVALSRALLRVAGDSALSSRLGRQAKARVEEDFSLLVQVEATAMSYIKACKKT
ncbi:MAG: glycosyl transferase family 1, partial [bacterium]|nr:glycosyl transferase family 1 [bacterium]